MIIAVVDDDDSQRKAMERLLFEWTQKQGRTLLCDAFEDGESFLKSGKRYEVVFLDIYMKELDGIETGVRLRQANPSCAIIYLTVSEDHRAEAFRVHAFDYLEKPVSAGRLEQVMSDLLRSVPGLKNRLLLPVGKAQIPVDLSLLRQITSDGNYCMLHMKDCVRVRIPFAQLEDILLGDRRFLKVNRGIMVNMDYVCEIENHSCRMKNGETFPVNMRMAAALQRDLVHYQFELRNRMLTEDHHGRQRG